MIKQGATELGPSPAGPWCRVEVGSDDHGVEVKIGDVVLWVYTLAPDETGTVRIRYPGPARFVESWSPEWPRSETLLFAYPVPVDEETARELGTVRLVDELRTKLAAAEARAEATEADNVHLRRALDAAFGELTEDCLLYTSPSPRD